MKKAVKYLLCISLVLFVSFCLSGLSQAREVKKINLNEASVQELVTIKGIGQKYAEKIIEYRENNGKFEKIEDIMKVKGIGKKKFEKIKDIISVEQEEKE